MEPAELPDFDTIRQAAERHSPAKSPRKTRNVRHAAKARIAVITPAFNRLFGR